MHIAAPSPDLVRPVPDCILSMVGNTPLLHLPYEPNPLVNLFVKVESFNPTGSIKARAAYYILTRLLREQLIDRQTTIIESSSGNFGVALAAFSRRLGLKFKCVVDPNLLLYNRMLMENYGAELIMVDTPDANGGYLLTRIAKVRSLLAETDNCYWVNQYGSPMNADAYYHTLGEEVCVALEELDYAFIGVSSGGTITGLSRKLKERYPGITIIAVDTHGSVLFGGTPGKRYIPGIGSSLVPGILELAHIDEVVRVAERDAALMCHELLRKHYLFAGGSSGSVYAAVNRYFAGCPPEKPVNVLSIFPDGGEKYIDTVFNPQWCARAFGL